MCPSLSPAAGDAGDASDDEEVLEVFRSASAWEYDDPITFRAAERVASLRAKDPLASVLGRCEDGLSFSSAIVSERPPHISGRWLVTSPAAVVVPAVKLKPSVSL